jgi:hypothetical protein
MLDEALIPHEGRQVRCISCYYVWRQIPDPSQAPPPPLVLGGDDLRHPLRESSAKESSWMGWLLFGSLFVVGLSVIIFGRNFIVSYWPEGERYYALMGLPISLPGSGLAITNASSQIHYDGQREMIRVMGNVLNTSESVHPIPPLKIKLIGDLSHPHCFNKPKDGNSCILASWDHRLSEQSLLPGEKIHFETDPYPTVEGSQHVRVEF